METETVKSFIRGLYGHGLFTIVLIIRDQSDDWNDRLLSPAFSSVSHTETHNVISLPLFTPVNSTLALVTPLLITDSLLLILGLWNISSKIHIHT